MADFDIERPTVEAQNVQPTYNINPPQFTIEIPGGFQGQRGEKGDTGAPGRDGVDGTNGIDGQDGQDGVSVTSIEQTTTSTESGGTNIITATLSNGDVSTFEIMNGLAGEGGITPLEDPIVIQDLEEGLYMIPANTAVHGVQEVGDVQFTTKGTAIISITHDLVPDAVDPDTKYDVASYYVIQDASVYISESQYSVTPTIDTTMLFGAVCDDSGDEWTVSEFSLRNLGNVLTKNDVIDNLTSTITNKPLSAKQGKILKGMLDDVLWWSSYNTVNDPDYEGNVRNEEYRVVDEPYLYDDDTYDYYINTNSIMYTTDYSNWTKLNDVIASKQNEITALNKLDYSLIDNQPTIPTNTSDLNNDSGFITSETDPVFSASAAAGISSSDISNWNGKSNFSGSYNDLTDKPTLFSGDYTDLTNKPTIPDELSDLSDDTTHRLVTDSEKSTWSGKQDALVSGTNIKTINNNSLLGSGNITISGGGGTATDVQINGDSIVVSDVANILTETAYDSSTNKIATMSDIPDTSDFIDKDVNNLTNYSLTTNIQTNKNLTKGVEYIVGTQASSTNLWTGTSTDTGCSSGNLYTGKVIIYHLPIAGSSSAATLNLTLPDGTTTGAKNIYRQASSTVTTTFAADCDILMVYDGTQWKVNAYVDTTNSNSIGYQLRTDKGVYVNGASTSIYRYQLLVQTENGLEPFTSTSNNTKTTKTQLSPKYLPGGDIRYYSSTTEITTGSDITSSSLWMQYHLDLRYSFNITSTTFTAKKPVYMKMSVNADGTLSPVYSALSGGHPLTQTLPTTADGYVYLHLGTAYSAYQLQLEINHPMYEYKNGKLREYVDASGGTITETDPVFTSSAAYGISSSDITAWNGKSNFSGDYNDLTNKPTIPTVPTNISSFVNDSGYITGISSGDVTTALGYTPYSSANPNGYTSNTGTITSVKMNGTTVSSSGEADLGTVLTSHQSIKTINSTSLVGTGDVTVQPTLVSGTNIKTINGTSVLGSGDLTIGEIKELSSTVILDDLSSGIYHLAKGTVLKYKESENDNNPNILTEVNKSALMIFSIKEESGKPLFSYIILQDDHDGTYYALNDDYTLDVGSNTHIIAGCMSPYTGSSWNEGDFNINEVLTWSDIVNNLTTNNSSKVLSAAQGKVLKDTIDAITIPTVNDSTITIQKNGTTVDSFTTNASSGKSINITVPTNTSDLNNNSNFVSLEVIDAQDIDDITSTSDATYIKIKDLVDNNIPFRISDFDPIEPHTYDVIDTQIYSGNYWISYIVAENKALRTLKLTKSGSTVTVSYSTKLQLSSTTWIDSLF